jgi:hypothetical protein
MLKGHAQSVGQADVVCATGVIGDSDLDIAHGPRRLGWIGPGGAVNRMSSWPQAVRPTRRERRCRRAARTAQRRSALVCRRPTCERGPRGRDGVEVVDGAEGVVARLRVSMALQVAPLVARRPGPGRRYC